MTNKTVTLSRELAQDILDGGYCKVTVMEQLRAALADPVPPAGGEVEVERYDMSGWGDGMVEREDGAFVYFDDHRAHVTRLQAELSQKSEAFEVAKGMLQERVKQCTALQSALTSANADKEAYAQNAIDLRNRVDALQDELTKARECIANALGFLRADKSIYAQCAIVRYQGVAGYEAMPVAHQPAPAEEEHEHPY
jgi:hypothetical protein